MNRRLSPDVRKDEILAAALALAARDGYQNVTREAIAERAGCSTGLVTKYFSTMPQLKRAVMRAAVAGKVVAVIAQGLADKNQYARKAPEDLKRQALASLAA